MKYINKSRLLGAVLLMLFILPAAHLSAQKLKPSGFTCGDTTIFYYKDNNHQFKSIKIGSPDPGTRNQYCSFFWDVLRSPNNSAADYSFDDVNSPTPTLTCFEVGMYQVQATRVSEYGYQTEVIIVDLTNELTLESAKDTKGCWEHGDQIKPDEFEFKTCPAGYEEYVRVKETRVQDYWVGNTTIHFQIQNPATLELEDSDYELDIYVNIGELTGVGEAKALRDAFATFPELVKVHSEFKILTRNVKGLGEKAKQFDKFSILVGGFSKGGPLKTEFINNVDIDAKLGFNCCQRGLVAEPVFYAEFTGTVEIGAKAKAYIPLWPPIPKFGINLTLGGSIRAYSTTGFVITKYSECDNIYMDLGVDGELNIGVALVLLDPDIIALGAEGYGEVNGKLRIQSSAPYAEINEMTGSVGLRVYGTFLGFNKVFFNYQSESMPLF